MALADPAVLGANIDTFIAHARIGDVPQALAHEFDERKVQSHEIEDDLPARDVFAGETLSIKPHSVGQQWRWILRSPSSHIDVGLGTVTHIVAATPGAVLRSRRGWRT